MVCFVPHPDRTEEAATVDQVNDPPPTNWEQVCEAVQHETDPIKLVGLLTTIENSIFERLQELGAKDSQERVSIDNAIATLRRLQVEKLNYPKWETEKPKPR